jgi:hypothetical protein
MFKHFYFLTLLILAVGVSCKAIQKKSTYLVFLNLSLLSIFLFGCNKLNKIDKNLKKLQEGKYNLECVIHNSNSNETDTISRICIGPDSGSQYRSAIFYQNEQERKTAQATIDALLADKTFTRITTELAPFTAFYKAEAYHQDFECKNPNNGYVKAVSIPRLEQFQLKMPEVIKKEN